MKKVAVSQWTHYETVFVKTPQTHQSAWRRPCCFLAGLAVMTAAATLLVPASGAADPTEAKPAARKLYEAKCLRCHKTLDPTIYEEMTWKRWLWKMKDKARLDNEEYGDLSDYLKGVREAARSRKTR